MLERFTLVSPPAFVLVWAVFLAFALRASWGATTLPVAVVLVLLGGLIWTLFEYAMHRFIFHWKPSTRFGRWLIFLSHGNHHDQPGDRYRNIMPPVVSVGISGAIWFGLWSAFDAPGSVIFVGFGIGYVVYDTIHFACHQLPMRSGLMRVLRRHHIRHHHAATEGNYAITAVFWDRVFGTEIPHKGR